VIAAAIAGSAYYMLTLPKGPVNKFFDPKVYNAESMYAIRGTLDPALHLEGYHIVQMAHSYEGLIKNRGSSEPDVWGETLPCLATTWETSADVKQYTFHLRTGVKFHDGTQFNAEAVKFSIQRTIALGAGPGISLAPIKTIDVLDNYTVRFNLDYPYAPLLAILASHSGKAIMSPTYVMAHNTTEDPWAKTWMESHECGTGPYALAELVPEVRLVFQKFNDYWGGWEPIEGKYPRIETIRYIQVNDYSTAKLMLQSGELDTIEHYTPSELSTLDALPDIAVENLKSWRMYHWLFNFVRSPTDNIYVRRAIAYGCDYATLVNQVLAPSAFMAEGPIPPGMKYYEPDSAFNYSLELAKQNLVMAGYPDGQGLPALEMGILSGNEQQRLDGPFLASCLAKIGITMTVIEKPVAYWKDLSQNSPGNFPHIFRWANLGVFNDPDCITSLFFHSASVLPGGMNYGHYSNATVDEMIDTGRILPEAARGAHYSQLLMMLKEDAAATQCYGLNVVTLRREWLRGDRQYHPNLDRGYMVYTMYKTE
jgi:ABC-type transport system substrate-binding protein